MNTRLRHRWCSGDSGVAIWRYALRLAAGDSLVRATERRGQAIQVE